MTEAQRIAFKRRAAELKAAYPESDSFSRFGDGAGWGADEYLDKFAGHLPVVPEISIKEARSRPDLLAEDYFSTQRVTLESPEIYARLTVKHYAKDRWGLDLDPDETLITTLFIENAGRPAPYAAQVEHSMTLTQAMLRNWQQEGDGHWWDKQGHLEAYRDDGFPVHIVERLPMVKAAAAYEAIYTKTTPQRYDSTTHLTMPAVDFKQFIWDCDLQANYFAYLHRFWLKNEGRYTLLVKGALIKSAYLQAKEGSLSPEFKQLVLGALGLGNSESWETLEFGLFENAPVSPYHTFRELTVHGYRASDIIVIKNELNGKVVLYIPGNSSPLHGFDSQSALKDWIGQQCRGPVRRRALESHFQISDSDDGLTYSGVHTALAGMGVYPQRLYPTYSHWAPRDTITLGDAISPWPITHFKERVRQRCSSDAVQSIHTRNDNVRDACIQGLENAIAVVGLVAMVSPELMPLLAAMSLVLVGVGVDQTVEGRTLEERKQGLDRIGFGVLNALPLAIKPLAALAEAAEAAAIAAKAEESASIVKFVDAAGQPVHEIHNAADLEALMTQESELRQAEAQATKTRFDDTEREWHDSQDILVLSQQRSTQIERVEQLNRTEQARVEEDLALELEFGPEPPALKSLGPTMRAKLTALESSRLLRDGTLVSVDGANEVYQITDDLDQTSETFIHLHSKVYRVEWIDSAAQYKIISPTGEDIPGPYVKEITLGHWDLDLKAGLRGGESIDGSQYFNDKPAINTQPDIVPVQISVPFDGIDEVDGRYRISLKGKTTRVYYDADLGRWRETQRDRALLWRDGHGAWQIEKGSNYAKVVDDLPRPADLRTITLRRLPQLPLKTRPLPRDIHYIWLGTQAPSTELIANIGRNARFSPDFTSTIHVDIDSEDVLSDLRETFKIHAPSVRVSTLKDEAFYGRFLKHENAEVFTKARGGGNRNYAAAADILRYPLINNYGGIYMDCDDFFVKSIEGVKLYAASSDLLLGKLIDANRFNFSGYNNSCFASLPDNPVLTEVSNELHVRYLKDPDFFDRPRPHVDKSTAATFLATTNEMTPYMDKVFELTGPKLLNDVVKRVRPDYYDLGARRSVPDQFDSVAYDERLNDAVDHYFPFATKAPVSTGGANSWN